MPKARQARVPVYLPWNPYADDDDTEFEGSLRTKAKPGPPLPDEARAQGTACTCPWCL